MKRLLSAVGLWLALILVCETGAAETPPVWRVLIANDTCPDVTWGLTEPQVRQAFADLLRAHLDEMTRTDPEPPESRDHYNLMAFVEAEAFLEKHPERTDEFLRRVREGRIGLTPFLCNTLWGWQSVEGVLRSFNPAFRLARTHDLPLGVANHTELPSLPWGMATILAGCGIRWVSVPFLDYDSTFQGLQNPPLFRLEGPDGSEVRVILDAWASRRANYRQGGYLLEDTRRVAQEWLPHYRGLGGVYPLRTIYASGTHSDISLESWKQVRAFAERIAAYNTTTTDSVRLVNGTLAQFCQEVDEAEAAAPFLPRVRGCFGHSWERWPVSLAGTVAAAREDERTYLAAESLAALACRAEPGFAGRTRAVREQAERCWAMLADHAWNGTDLGNQRHNAELRHQWARRWEDLGQDLARAAWEAIGLRTAPDYFTVFNPLGFTNDFVLTVDAPAEATGVRGLASSHLLENGTRRLRFVAPHVPPFGFREYRFETNPVSVVVIPPFHGSSETLEGPFYRLRVDPSRGGLASLVHRASGHELVLGTSGRSFGQTVLQDTEEHLLHDIASRTRFDATSGEMVISGHSDELRVTQIVRIYASLDRVDFEFQVEHSPTPREHRLLHFFPVNANEPDLRIETPAAVLRPRPQPDGDLLPGADPRRFAVQGFVDVSSAKSPGLTLVPLDAYLLRLDQGALAFEALGNDQNWKEVTRDQNGVRQFRFRYSLRVHPPGYDNAAAMACSRALAAPGTVAFGGLPGPWLDRAHLEIDPRRAIVTSFKPADDGTPAKVILRFWETQGEAGPVRIDTHGFKDARLIDLRERELGRLALDPDGFQAPVRARGLSGVSLQ